MARGNRLTQDGGIFHVTHRCHNRMFLLKFACDRDAYREKLREHLPGLKLALLDYCLTSNHIHLLIDAPDRLELSWFLRAVQGEFARAYNQRKHRRHAFWGDNYHATHIDTGEYVWRCLCYIEMNMVRTGLVEHPRQWPWSGYREIMGHRRRYRLIDLDRLAWRLGSCDIENMRSNFESCLADRSGHPMKREACWTESLAVGSVTFLEKIKPHLLFRQETEIMETTQGVWVLRDQPIPYGQKTGLKSSANA